MSQKLNIREMRGDDIFPLLNILSIIDITDEVVEMMQGNSVDLPPFPILDINIAVKVESGDVLSKVEQKSYEKFNSEYNKTMESRSQIIEKRGKENIAILLRKLLSNIQLVRKEVNEFLGSMCDLDHKEAAALPIAQYTSLIIEVFNRPELLEVFTSAAQLNKTITESTD